MPELDESQLEAIETIKEMDDDTLVHWADHFRILPRKPISALRLQWLLEDHVTLYLDAAVEIVND
jgi:hypothetical protein